MKKKLLASLIILCAFIAGVPFSPAALAATATSSTHASHTGIIDGSAPTGDDIVSHLGPANTSASGDSLLAGKSANSTNTSAAKKDPTTGLEDQ